jgi:predicted SprT family Zn-dependent metalloprotease
MNLSEAQRHARRLFTEFGIDQQGWRFAWDNAKRRHGCTHFSKRTISLSKPITAINECEVVDNTIRHEIAHVLAGPTHHHDATWKRYAVQCGARPERCVQADSAEQVPAKIYGICPNCDHHHPRHRAPKAGAKYFCNAPPCRHLPHDDRLISWRRAR